MSSDQATVRAREHLLSLLSTLPQGEKLPGERTLAEDFGVCRVTLRRAVEDLISDGRLERRARSGTYVRRPVISSELRLQSFTEEIRARGQNPTTKMISIKRTKPNKTISKTLRIGQSEDIYSVVRLRLADGVPIALETLKIACRSIPHLTEQDVEKSLYDTFLEKYGKRIASARAGIAGYTPTERERTLLQISSKTPCLVIKMIDKDQNDQPVMTAECIYRSDLFELKLDVTSSRNQYSNRRVS
jgi:GntR family transcriptional regulator